MKQKYSAIVKVKFTRHYKHYSGVRIVPIDGTFSDARSARTHFRSKYGEVLIVVPSGDAHHVVSESNYRLIPGNGV